MELTDGDSRNFYEILKVKEDATDHQCEINSNIKTPANHEAALSKPPKG
jgi:hypothetical protein